MKTLLLALLAAVPASSYAASAEPVSSAHFDLENAMIGARRILHPEASALVESIRRLGAHTGDFSRRMMPNATGLSNLAALVDSYANYENGAKEVNEMLAYDTAEIGVLFSPLGALVQEANEVSAAAKPGQGAADAALALRGRIETLRQDFQGMQDDAKTAAAKIERFRDKLGDDNVRAARNLVGQIRALEQLMDALVARAGEIAKKS